MELLGQPVFRAILTFFIVSIALLVALVVLLQKMQSNKAKQQARKKAEIDAVLNPTANPKGAKTRKDGDDLEFLTSSSSTKNSDDPLADLYQSDFDDDDDEVDLGSLLPDTGEEKVHTIAEKTVRVQLVSGEKTQARELLSILRDESDGRLMVLAGDTAYRTLINDPAAKKQFTTLMKELAAIILKADTRPEKVASKPAETVKHGLLARQNVKADSEKEVNLSVQAAKELEIEERLPGDLPSMKLPDNPDNYEKGRLGWTKVKRIDKAPELNIAAAIEAYLQYKIEQNPEYQRRGIHIKPAISGGVSIEADGKVYEFVDEIADSDVREFIQTAINEWQERH
ncbi:MAG: hypothetical protein Q9P01_09045 [Anaerolineae bacterium]|nr:hypothetical protein [Anaerolineae bacterium]MDQ7034963.1 hypothetical protein [Anaerolineae bacterium]